MSRSYADAKAVNMVERGLNFTILGLSIIAFLLTGMTISSLGLFIQPMRLEFHWTHSAIARIPAAFFAGSALAALGSGWLVDRLGPRGPILSGIVLTAAGLFSASLASSMFALLAAFTLAGVGMSIEAVAAIYRLSQQRRLGLAMGFYLLGSAGGTAIMPLGIEAIIAAWGWRQALLANAALALLIALPLASRATSQGQRRTSNSSPLIDSGEERSLRGILTSFFLVLLTAALSQTALIGILVYFVPVGEEIGWSSAKAVWLLGFSNLMGSLGGVGIGWLADRLNAVKMLAGAIVLHAVSIYMFRTLSKDSSLMLILAFAFLWGVFSGCTAQLIPLLIRKVAPMAMMGRCLGVNAFAGNIAAALAPMIIGYLADMQGSYRPGVAVMALIALVAVVPLFFLRLAPSPREVIHSGNG